MRHLSILILSLFSLCCLSSSVMAQGYGGGGAYGGAGGTGSYSQQGYGFRGRGAGTLGGDVRPTISVEESLNVIAVSATVETRIPAEEIRLVLGLTSEQQSAQAALQDLKARSRAIREDLSKIGILEGKVVEDFISVLPKLEWTPGKWEEENIRIQKLIGYRMQLNLHISVPTEAKAMEAIDKTFQHGHAEVIIFDYWSSQIEKQKQDAMAAAVGRAKVKAETLLSVFDKVPPVINVREETQVFFPNALYETYTNLVEDDLIPRYWQDRMALKMFRPKMTFYRGAISNADVLPKTAPMRPEITVMSTVSIFYESPATKSSGRSLPQ